MQESNRECRLAIDRQSSAHRLEPHHKGDEVTGPKSTGNPDALYAPLEKARGRKPLALLLDLSGDKAGAMDWAARLLPPAEIRPIDKADLKWGSKRDALRLVRSLAPDTLAVFTSDLGVQSARRAIMLFAAVAGARRIVVGDRSGRAVTRSRLTALLLEGPSFALELIAGYLLIVPFSWLLTAALGAALRFRATARSSNNWKRQTRGAPLTALYLRATIAGAAEGGMATHVAGFAGGAAGLGHRLRLIESGCAQLDRGPHSSRTTRGVYRIAIRPSALLGATKALFELWNNLVFTARSLRLTAGRTSEIDFLYQRYNRFNWTGVVLSLVTGRTLALEFNGSEVWISKQWDPAGQLWLLGRFERLNLRAADLIFVVSDVERRNLMKAGVDPSRIIVNPNGVDTEKFHPGCGGREIRQTLGITDEIVLGFTGTFGPWHGAPVMAEAACLLNKRLRFRLLFIGDGEQRAATESIIKRAGNVEATFTGRVPHALVPPYLDACDILVSPHVPPADGSEFFGSPTKLFEYMALGRPVIASRLGQIADVIADGESGLLVEPGDAAALTRAIERLAGDAAMRARLGARARETVIERYTWRHNAARVFDAVEEMCMGGVDNN